jgi:hypothetical protein
VRYWRLFRHRERAGARTTGHRRNRQPGDGEDG